MTWLDWVTIGLWCLWSLWVAQAVLSVFLVRKFYRRKVRLKRARRPMPTPRAVVIVPFKGMDVDLPAGVRALCEQRYEDYRLVCVVESEDDPAVPVLRRELARYPDRRSEVLITGRAAPTQGQKVHNQLVALAHVNKDCRDADVWVFADSDAIVGTNWLYELVGPLRNERVGVTTGYRWLVPAGEKPTLWSRLASAMNSSAACFCGNYRLNQAWGGSMAVRVGVARAGHLVERLTGAITDDYPVTRMAREHGLRVRFVSRCLVPTPVDFTLATLANFAYRQYLITRVYAPRLYAGAVALAGLYTLGLLTASAWLVFELVTRRAEWWLPIMPAGALVAVFVADVVRSVYRRQIVRYAFDDSVNAQLRGTLLLDRWATWLWMPVHGLLMLSALTGRTMNWRGIRYEVRGRNDVRRL